MDPSLNEPIMLPCPPNAPYVVILNCVCASVGSANDMNKLSLVEKQLPEKYKVDFDGRNSPLLIDNLHVRLIFDLGKKKYIPVKNLLKSNAKCCKVQKI
jgi:hypothetical protein